MVTHRQSKTDLNNENQQFSIWIVVWYTNKLFLIVGLKTNVKGARRRSWLSWWASSLEGTWPIGGKGGGDTVEHWTTKLYTRLEKKSKPWDSNAGLTNYIGPNGVKGWIFKWKERSIKFYRRLCTRKKVEVVDGTRSQALDVCSTIQKCSMTFWRGSRFSGFFWSSLVMRSRAPERTNTPLSWKSYCDYLAHSLRKLTQLILEGSRMITL